MMIQRRFAFLLLFLLCATFLLSPGLLSLSLISLGGRAEAAEPGSDEAEPVPLREQSIYVPYGKLREVFEKDAAEIVLLDQTRQKSRFRGRENDRLAQQHWVGLVPA